MVSSDQVGFTTWKFYSRRHDLVNRYGMSVSQMTTDMLRMSYPQPVLLSFRDFSARTTRKVPLVEHKPRTLLEHMSSPHVFSGIRVVRFV